MPRTAVLPAKALIGVRACELAALTIQDRVFTSGTYRDGYHGEVRARAFVPGVTCTESAANCFCASMGTGPAVRGACGAMHTRTLRPRRPYPDQAGGVLAGRIRTARRR